MSVQPPSETTASAPIKRLTVPNLIKRKQAGEPLVTLTAYTAPMARLLDPHCELLLVGDSMGMALYGMDSTLGVTIDMIINHGRAVVRGSKRALVALDMPFGSFEASKQVAFTNAARMLSETGAQAVKLEGGKEMAETVHFLVERGIPVIGHVGLRPQSVHVIGGYAAQGRDEDAWEPIIEDAKAIEAAGAFATVVEGVAEPLAAKITESVNNVVIGIGASAACDGQILVTEDMLGLFDWAPRFVKHYASLGPTISDAVARYADDVRARRFPSTDETYKMRRPKK
ncbi:3-methyl-2-oxobutanoate hydroxymethyltransferase [Iodidimonas muriae]|uniref:3-methyl-2-oxobutanoate hydroxymethyltransferase n=1 Tax=Iodidimonas muriae TaxID=261467 RepID=A0ABQ2LE62_9PROT|nr:3-methyl-2-oxobutanoate hydroxymethyltransferase [Iodidimonas muriae]GER07065.1 3-methyl-2-oxobutanoate hydroxymethyltransferase [Kordiimonadales bacterium JCM 17843]GGO13145.1 3-methyl-2-oxobutanoate hydroxymethyltransferase [Iodidimonas muriae]